METADALVKIIPTGNALLGYGLVGFLIFYFREEIRKLIPQIEAIELPGGSKVQIKQSSVAEVQPSQASPSVVSLSGAIPTTGKELVRLYDEPIGNSEMRKADLYLDHDAYPTERKGYYLFDIYINAEWKNQVDRVAQVSYILHESYGIHRVHIVKEIGERKTPFKLGDVLAFGESCVVAKIDLKDGGTFIDRRYLTFVGRLARTPPG